VRLAPEAPLASAPADSGGVEVADGGEAAQVADRVSAENELPAVALRPHQSHSAAQAQAMPAGPVAPGSVMPRGPAAVAHAANIPAHPPATAPALAAKSEVPSPQTAEPALARPAHEAGRAEAVQQIALSVIGQPVLAAADGASLVRDPAGGRSAHDPAGRSAGESAGVGGGSASAAMREPFAALDAGTAAVTPTWIHAGAQRAEAGFQDPALGWVGVRAEASGGSMHAALVPGSAEAAQTLAGHLAGLNAYLASEHSPVAAVTVAAAEERTDAYSLDQGANQNFSQGAGQGAAGQQSAPAAFPAAARRIFPAPAPRAEATGTHGIQGGAHISVIA
jgi:hypothetical protein